MLRSLDLLVGSVVRTVDGDLGEVRDFLFDDRAWTIRYLIVETGTWFSSRRVLISPVSAGQPDWERRVVPVNLSMDQLRASPDVDTAKPVSRLEEVAMSQYYGWPAYWSMEPPLIPVVVRDRPNAGAGDNHLRSEQEVKTYQVHASDLELGAVDDLIIEDSTWFIRYLIVSTGGWLRGQKLLLSTRWVRSILWSERQIHLSQPHDQL